MSAPDDRGGRARGRVLLVGAGPGDPDLITVRGAAALSGADAVVFDALASPTLLDLAPSHAERINVGKHGHEEPTRSQGEINALLVRLATEGKTVVRLKGGDCFVFGRGGEEAMACVEAGIPFEVVPGVSSVIGALAYAGIPVTDRRYSASFAVVTGHKDPTRVSEETRWGDLARAADTLVILMGMRNLDSLLTRLMEGGRAATTPAAAIMNGTLPTQRVVEAPLGELARRVVEEGIGAPAAVVIGDVVKLREALAWYENLPLFGSRVVVTRAAQQAEGMGAAIREAGGEPVVIPMIQLEPPEVSTQLDSALARCVQYDAILFTSANAVRFLEARAVELGRCLAGNVPQVACVGPLTADEARRAGLAVALTAEGRFDAEGLLDSISKHWSPEGLRFLLPQAEEARPTLADGLRTLGAVVDTVAVYRTTPAPADGEALCAQLLRSEFDALTFTSPSTARCFAALLDESAHEAARRCVIAAIGPITVDALRELGLEPDVVPERATVRDLVAALSAHVAARTQEGRR